MERKFCNPHYYGRGWVAAVDHFRFWVERYIRPGNKNAVLTSAVGGTVFKFQRLRSGGATQQQSKLKI